MWELYNEEHKYFSKEGFPLSHDDIKKIFPVIDYDVCVVNILGVCVQEIDTLAQARYKRDVPKELDDEQACAYMTYYDEMKGKESTPLERIAAALEFIAMSYL